MVSLAFSILHFARSLLVFGPNPELTLAFYPDLDGIIAKAILIGFAGTETDLYARIF